MGTSLAQFLARLAVDPEALGSYLRDAERVMRDAGLRRRDREALASGDQAALLARLYPEAPAAPVVADQGDAPATSVPASGGDGPATEEDSMIWGYAPTDPSTSWHYAANVVGATAPMWFSAPTMWQQSGPAPADAAAAPPMWHAAAGGPAPMWHQAPAGPPPMWHAAPSFAAPPSMWMQGGGSVSVVHVVHHFAGPAPTPPPAPEQTGEGPRAD